MHPTRRSPEGRAHPPTSSARERAVHAPPRLLHRLAREQALQVAVSAPTQTTKRSETLRGRVAAASRLHLGESARCSRSAAHQPPERDVPHRAHAQAPSTAVHRAPHAASPCETSPLHHAVNCVRAALHPSECRPADSTGRPRRHRGSTPRHSRDHHLPGSAHPASRTRALAPPASMTLGGPAHRQSSKRGRQCTRADVARAKCSVLHRARTVRSGGARRITSL